MPVQESYDVTSAEIGVKRTSARPRIHSESWLIPLIAFFVLSGLIVTLCLLLWSKQDRSDIDHFNKSSSQEADFKRGALVAHRGSDRTHEVSNQPDTNPVLVSSTSEPTKIRSTGTAGDSGNSLGDEKKTPQGTSGDTTKSQKDTLHPSTDGTFKNQTEPTTETPSSTPKSPKTATRPSVGDTSAKGTEPTTETPSSTPNSPKTATPPSVGDTSAKGTEPTTETPSSTPNGTKTATPPSVGDTSAKGTEPTTETPSSTPNRTKTATPSSVGDTSAKGTEPTTETPSSTPNRTKTATPPSVGDTSAKGTEPTTETPSSTPNRTKTATPSSVGDTSAKGTEPTTETPSSTPNGTKTATPPSVGDTSANGTEPTTETPSSTPNRAKTATPSSVGDTSAKGTEPTTETPSSTPNGTKNATPPSVGDTSAKGTEPTTETPSSTPNRTKTATPSSVGDTSAKGTEPTTETPSSTPNGTKTATPPSVGDTSANGTEPTTETPSSTPNRAKTATPSSVGDTSAKGTEPTTETPSSTPNGTKNATPPSVGDTSAKGTEPTTETPSSTPNRTKTATPSSVGDTSAKGTEPTTETPSSTPNRTKIATELFEDTSLNNNSNKDDNNLSGDKNLLGRRRVSRMLSHMNHMADPCEDFYEYACGEFEANPLILQKDLLQEGVERIFAQAKTTENSNVAAQFLSFYDSCVNYEKNMNQSEKIKLAIKAVDEVGNFTYPGESRAITDLLSKLFLRNSIPLFDITPDVVADPEAGCGESSEDVKFTLKIGPPILDSTYYSSKRERDCYEGLNSKRLAENVDLTELYTDYEKCKKESPSFFDSIEQVLKEFPGAKSKESDIRLDIDMLIWKYFSEMYPAKDAIREAYLTKNYTEWTLEQLQAQTDITFLDWKQLLKSVSNLDLESDLLLQVYFGNEIVKGLQAVYHLLQDAINNPFVGLYAHTVYDKLVVPKHDVENHCKSVTVDLMKKHASSLYMSSFSSEELKKMEALVMKMFEELKDRLKSNVKKASGLQSSDDALIIRKIDNLSIALPNVSYYHDRGELDPENSENKIDLSGNYFNDVMMLEGHNRKSMYGLLKKSPSEDEYIWKYFAQPYQNSSSVIYALNKIILPYGIVDWATLLNDQNINSKHLALATLGTRIAKEIAHHFDPTGIKYFGKKRSNGTRAIFCNDTDANETYSEYIGTSYLPIDDSLLLTSTQQTVSYKITDFYLNERFADNTGLQLAYDTMLRIPNISNKILPWLSDDETNEKKQFFLAYAQMYCTKVPLTSSYKSFYEDEHLPSRLLISVIGSSNEFWGETWKCPIGSKMRPADIPSAFPNMESKSAT